MPGAAPARFSAPPAAGLGAALLFALPGAAAAADPAPPADRLAPHRAIYALTLDRLRPDSGFAGASGAIFYRLGATCTAWRTRERFRLRIARIGRAAVETDSEATLVEARDGRRLSFASVTKTDGRVTERLSGIATLSRVGGPGTVELREPEPARIALPAGTVFPIRHVLAVLRAARQGRRTVWSSVFDGLDENGRPSGVNAVILGRVPSPGAAEARPILRRPGWSMRIAWFAPDAADGGPTHSFRAEVGDNGVTRRMRLDYGDFAMTGTLKAIEPLPHPKC